MLPIASQAKVVTFNISPTDTSGNPSSFPYNFDLSPSTANYAEAFCPELKKMGAKSFALIHGDDPFADSITDEISKQCSAAGLKVTGNQAFKPDSLDVARKSVV